MCHTVMKNKVADVEKIPEVCLFVLLKFLVNIFDQTKK